ncbi:MAG: hypothetical protein ACT4OP_13260, partial [Actinomycetota bacterium]
APHFIVNLSSDAHYAAKTFDLGRAVGPTRSLTGWPEYARSKAAMASHIIELAARFPAIHCVAVHPGTVATEIWRRIPGPLRWLVTRSMGSPAEGAQVVLRAMTDPDVKSGSYLTPAGARQPSGLVKAPEQRQALWERSMEWVERFT